MPQTLALYPHVSAKARQIARDLEARFPKRYFDAWLGEAATKGCATLGSALRRLLGTHGSRQN